MTALQSPVPGIGAVPAGDAPREPIRIPMTSVLLVVAAVLAVVLVTGLLTGVPPLLIVLGLLVTAAVLFALVFAVGAITIAGFASGAATAGVVAVEPGSLPAVLLVLALVACLCGVAPGWARVETWQAVRSSPLRTRAETAATPRSASPAGRLVAHWRTDRVVAAFLVLAFPPMFVTGAIAFVTWTATR